MEVARIWRLKQTMIRFVGEECPHCSYKTLVPRDVCPNCGDEEKESEFANRYKVDLITRLQPTLV